MYQFHTDHPDHVVIVECQTLHPLADYTQVYIWGVRAKVVGAAIVFVGCPTVVQFADVNSLKTHNKIT